MRYWILIGLASALALGQQVEADRVKVPFSSGQAPRSLKAKVLNGSITVKGYNGAEAIIEARNRDGRKPSPATSGGLRRLNVSGSGLVVEEEKNQITVSAPAFSTVDLFIQVPVETSLKLDTTNGGNIEVENVAGEIDVKNINGQVTVRNVSGAVVAHALNGRVLAVLNRVTAGKPMSFSSLNGDIDVTLPPDVKANVKMKTDNGEIYTDFDIVLAPSNREPVVDERAGKRGKYRVRFDRAMYGAINGGGPEFQFTTLNGKIYIRKQGSGAR